MSGGTLFVIVVLAACALALLAIFQPWRTRHPEQLGEEEYLALMAGELPEDDNDLLT